MRHLATRALAQDVGACKPEPPQVADRR